MGEKERRRSKEENTRKQTVNIINLKMEGTKREGNCIYKYVHNPSHLPLANLAVAHRTFPRKRLRPAAFAVIVDPHLRARPSLPESLSSPPFTSPILSTT